MVNAPELQWLNEGSSPSAVPNQNTYTMLETIRESYTELIVEYSLSFKTDKHGGYVFPCNSDGNIAEGMESQPWYSNYQKCISGEVVTICPPFVDYSERIVRHPKVCQCDCGEELSMECDSEGLVYCYCGKCYNTAGQSIRPRSEWEERYDDDY